MNKFKEKWKIIEMEQWDQEYIDLVESGYFRFDDDGIGEFVFGTVSGFMDCRFSNGNDANRVEYSWEGTSEMETACGRGWFESENNNQIRGRLFIHNGDDSWVIAEKR